MQIENKDKPKQNAQTNQTKPKNKSNETESNPQPNAHTQHNRERDRKRKTECERSGSRGSDLWWLTERFETVAVAIGSPSDGGNRFSKQRWCRWEAAVAAWCWEWGFLWESREESDWSDLQLRDLSFSWEWGFFCSWEWASVVFDVWVFFFFCFFFFILNLELCFIKRSSVWIEAAFY